MNLTMTKIVTSLVLAAAAVGAQAESVSTGGVLNVYSQIGWDTSGVVSESSASLVDGPDSTFTGFMDYSAGTWGVSSTRNFFALAWTTTGGSLIKTAGTYSLDTSTGAVSAAASCTVANDGSMCFTLGANQLAGSINVAWGSSTFHVLDVWNINPNGSLTAAVVPGTEDGPFIGWNWVIDLTAANLAPVPEASTYAMMLAGLGLVGAAARRRKQYLSRAEGG